MPYGNDFRNSLPVWLPTFIIFWSFIQGAVNAVWLKLAFHPELTWSDFMNELVSKPNEFFWVIVGLYIGNIIALIIGFLMLIGRSASKEKKIID